MWGLIVKDLKLMAGQAAILIAAAILLLSAGLLFSGKGGEGEEKAASSLRMGLIDEDKSQLSGILVHFLESDETFSGYLSLVTGEEAEIEKAFRQGELDAYLKIPPSFFDNLVRIDNIPMTVKVSTRDTAKAVLLKNLFTSYESFITAVQVNCTALYDQMERDGMDASLIDKKNQEISIKLVLTALGRDGFFRLNELRTAEALPYGEYYFYMLEGILVLFAGLYPGLRFLRERSSGVYLRGRSAGIRVYRYVLSGFLTSLLPLLFVFLAFHRFGAGLFSVPIRPRQYVVLAGFVITSVILGFLLAGLVRKEKAYMLAGTMVHLTACILGGAIVPFLFLPDGMKLAGSFMPIRLFAKLMAG